MIQKGDRTGAVEVDMMVISKLGNVQQTPRVGQVLEVLEVV